MILLLFVNFYLILQIKSQEIFDFNLSDDLLNSTLTNKTSRFLRPSFFRPSLLNIVRFPNEECFDTNNQSGTCYTAFECKKLGGQPSSPCARGLGTCCIVSRSCHNTTSNRVVYFRNPSYPLTDNQQNFCDLTVNIIDPDVCQLRIDFMDFQIDPPTLGNCLDDKFRVSASGFSPTSVPVLCGNNRNQHIYVSLPRNANDRSASLVFETNNVGDYRWHARVTQIDCNQNGNKKNILSDRSKRSQTQYSTALGSPFGGNSIKGKITALVSDRNVLYSMPAPLGCLQYFTAPIGMVESFNFGEYFNNLDYAICIERQPNTCRVIYSATDYQFSIDSVSSNSLSSVGDNDCAADYLMIPAASQTGDGFTYDRYCGGVLSYDTNQQIDSPVISKANGPIVIRFHTNNIHNPLLKDGFRLRYEQSSTDCMSTLLNGQLFNGNIPPPVANLVSQYSAKNSPTVELDSHEPIINLEKQIEKPNARNNAKQMKL